MGTDVGRGVRDGLGSESSGGFTGTKCGFLAGPSLDMLTRHNRNLSDPLDTPPESSERKVTPGGECFPALLLENEWLDDEPDESFLRQKVSGRDGRFRSETAN